MALFGYLPSTICSLTEEGAWWLSKELGRSHSLEHIIRHLFGRRSSSMFLGLLQRKDFCNKTDAKKYNLTKYVIYMCVCVSIPDQSGSHFFSS